MKISNKLKFFKLFRLKLLRKLDIPVEQLQLLENVIELYCLCLLIFLSFTQRERVQICDKF